MPAALSRLIDLFGRDPRDWPLTAQLIGALTAALLPLGLLALAAAIGNWRDLQASQSRLAATRFEAARQMVAGRLGQDIASLRDAAARATPYDRVDCVAELGRIVRRSSRLTSVARVDPMGAVLCGSVGGSPPPTAFLASTQRRQPLAAGTAKLIAGRDAASRDLLLFVRDNGARAAGDAVVARVPAALLPTLAERRLLGPYDSLTLRLDGVALEAWGAPETGRPRLWEAELGVMPGLTLALATPRTALTPGTALGAAAPILMWLFAIAVASVALAKIAAGPIRRMRSTVERYSAGDRAARVGRLGGGGQELGDLGRAFDAMADRLDRYQHEMEAALETQKALTREVHHRVKNNLQIVSSLISIQARANTDPGVAAAYALIRQRVNALALVHRWMYQSEAGAGVDLRALLADLAGNLEHGFEGRDGVRVIARVDQLAVGQDAALPVAFLVTELVAGAVLIDPAPEPEVHVTVTGHGARATLAVTSPSFNNADALARFDEGSARIITGLARQLRGQLHHNVERACFEIGFPVRAAQPSSG